MARRKIILFGGSFDPIHSGHLNVALAVLKALEADRLIFIPAMRSPLKKAFPGAKGTDRLEMIRLTIAGNPLLEVSDCELKRADPSYTLETVHYFRREFGPDARLIWLVGADAVRDLPDWYRIDELLELVEFTVMVRAGYPVPDFSLLTDRFGGEQIEKLQQNLVHVPLIHISSTEIRRRLTGGQPVRDMLHESAYNYIIENGLYQNC